MTVKQMKRLLKPLPDNMEIVMPSDEDMLITVCKEKSEVITIIPEEKGILEERVLLLLPCGCNEELELGDINSQPELN